MIIKHIIFLKIGLFLFPGVTAGFLRYDVINTLTNLNYQRKDI